jgi:hypothetical protein
MTEQLTPLDGDTTIILSGDEALVLFDLVSRYVDGSALEIVDPAEKRALWNLSALLERRLVTPFDPRYRERLEAARIRLRDPDE